MVTKCRTCKKDLKSGDQAYETEWKKIEVKDRKATFKVVKEYECVDHEEGKK